MKCRFAFVNCGAFLFRNGGSMTAAPPRGAASRRGATRDRGDGLGEEGPMSAQKTIESTKPLSHYVAHSLDGFFKALNGHAPKDLYGMILDQVEAPLLKATL